MVKVKEIFSRGTTGNYNVESTNSQQDENELTRKAAVVQVMISCLANWSVITTGIGLGYPAITTQLLLRDDADVILSPSQVSWFASVTAIACPIGGPLSGYLTDKIGRLMTLVVVDVVAIISWLIIGFSSNDDASLFFIQLMIGRSLIGVCIGMITTPAVMYSAEICHPKLRGRLTILSTPFFMAFGVLVAYFLGYLIPTNFRLVAFIAAGITVGTILILFLIPESPVYLIVKNKIDKGRKALAVFRNLYKNDPKIDAEIDKIKLSRSNPSKKPSFLDAFKEFLKPELYKPFIIMLMFFALQQFSGIFVVFVYAAQFSLEAGVMMDEFLAAVIMGIIRCVATVLVAFASDKFGRKTLVIASGVGMFLCMLGLALLAAFPLNDSNFSWLPATFLFFYIFIGTFGILTLPFAMVAEMYPQKSRGFAAGITMSLCFLMSFAVIKTFADAFELFGNVAVFSFYAFVSALGIAFGIFILPETKGKSLQDIENYFKKK